MKSYKPIVAFWLVFLTEHLLNVVIKRGLPLPGCQTVVPVLQILFSRLSMFWRFFSFVRKFTQQPYVSYLFWDEFLINMASFYNKCAKNCCELTVLVQLIIKDEITCFFCILLQSYFLRLFQLQLHFVKNSCEMCDSKSFHYQTFAWS